LKVASCYKCKAILPIRRAETKEVASNNVIAKNKKTKPVVEQTSDGAASEPTSEVLALAVAAAHELTRPALIEASHAASVSASSQVKIEEAPVVSSALPADVYDDADQKIDQPDHPPVELHDENYQKTIVLQRAVVEVQADVRENAYQQTIPVRRPLEKVHDEDYLKTIALQRAPEDALPAQRTGASQYPPAGAYDVNYQKTIALQRTLHPAPVDVHDEAYVKTISLRHPPASLAGGAAPQVAAEAHSLSSAISADLQAERARLPIDLVQKAKWGQRALLASFSLLVVVTTAYFFLRSEQTQIVSNANTDAEPAQLQTEAMARISAVPVSKAIDPLPLNVPIDAAKQTQNKIAAKIVTQRPPAAPLPAKQAVAPAQVTQQTKAAPTGQVLYLPPGATSASAAATAAAIAEAIGKTPTTQPVKPSSVPNTKSAPQTQAGVPAVENIRASEAATVKGTGNSGAVSSPPVPCTEALAALGLCVIQTAPQPAPPKQ
jgi:hypothetical protein